MRNRGVFVALTLLAVSSGIAAVHADPIDSSITPAAQQADPPARPKVFFPASAATEGSAVVAAPIAATFRQKDAGCSAVQPCAVPSPALNTISQAPPATTLSRLARPTHRHRG